MKAIFLGFFLPFSALATVPGPGVTAVEIDKLSARQKERCARHINIYQKNSIKSDCRAQYPDLGKYSDDLTQAFNASFTACRETVKFEEESEAKYQQVIREGTSRAEVIAGQIKGQNNQQQLLASASDATKVQMESFRERNVEIQQMFGRYRGVHDLLARIERYYDVMLQRVGSGNTEEGGLCPGGERNWFRVETSNLEREITSLRKKVAENVQELNKLYQKNLVAAGASQQQAVQLARTNLLMAGADSGVPVLQPVLNQFKASGAELGIKDSDIRTTDIRDSGNIKGADSAWYQRVFGTTTVHDKEWAKVNCPEGTESSACYDRMYRARNSNVDDATLAMFTGDQRLTGATQPVVPATPVAAAVDPVITTGTAIGPQGLIAGALSPQTLDRFPDKVSSIPSGAIGEQTRVTVDGREYNGIHTQVVDGTRVAYIPDGAGNFRAVKATDTGVSIDAVEPGVAAPAVVAQAAPAPAAAPYDREDAYKAEHRNTPGNLSMGPTNGLTGDVYVRASNGTMVINRQLASQADSELRNDADIGQRYTQAVSGNRSNTLAVQNWINGYCGDTFDCGVQPDGVMGPRTQLQMYQLLNHKDAGTREGARRAFNALKLR